MSGGERPASKLRRRATRATLAAMACGHELQALERQFRDQLAPRQAAAIRAALVQYLELQRSLRQAEATTTTQAPNA